MAHQKRVSRNALYHSSQVCDDLFALGGLLVIKIGFQQVQTRVKNPHQDRQGIVDGFFGILAKIVGRITGKEGDSTSLQFNSAFFNEGDPVVLTEDGSLKVKKGYDLKGQLGYYSNPAFAVPDAAVLLTGAAIKLVTTGENGNYEFLR